MSQEKDEFSLQTSDKQSAFDTSILALRAVHNEEVGMLKQEIARLNETIERLKQALNTETEKNSKLKASLTKTKKIIATLSDMKGGGGINPNTAIGLPQTASPALSSRPLPASARSSPRVPATPGSGSGLRVIGGLSGAKTTVKVPPTLAAAAAAAAEQSNETLPRMQLFSNNDKGTTTAAATDGRGGGGGGGGGRGDYDDDDDDDDIELPLKGVQCTPSQNTDKTVGSHYHHLHPSPSLLSSSSSSVRRKSTVKLSRDTPKRTTTSPGNNNNSSSNSGGGDADSTFWHIRRPGELDTPPPKKNLRTFSHQCAGAGVVPYTVRNENVLVLLYEPLRENDSKKGFLVDFGGPVKSGESAFAAASRTLKTETNFAICEEEDSLKGCYTVRNDDQGGYVIIFYKTQYQDPKNFEASSAANRNRMYRWVPLGAVLENDLSVLKYPLHERMSKAVGFYDVLGKFC